MKSFRTLRGRKKFLLSLYAAVLIVPAIAISGVAGASSAKASKAPYRLAFIDSLTGAGASIAIPNLAGWNTAIEYQNAHGGVNGRKIYSDTMNDNYTEATAASDLQNAYSSGDLGVFGENDSVSWAVLGAQAPIQQMMQLGIGLTDNYFDPPIPYTYGMSISYRGMANTMTGFIKNYLIAKKHSVPASPKVAIFAYSSPSITTLSSFWTGDAAKYNWPVTANQQFSVTTTNVSTQAQAVASSKPDVVLTALLDSDAPLAVSALRQAGYNGPIVDFTAASDTPVLQAINSPNYYSETDYLAGDFTSVPGAKQMDKEARATGNFNSTNETSDFFPLGYVAGLAAIQALKNCPGNCSRTALNNAFNHLGNLNTSGLSPGLAIRPGRHRIAQSVVFDYWDASKGHTETIGSWIYGGNF